VSNASTIITMPSSSHSSTCSGDGGLCEVRKALTPMPFISLSCRASASRFTADPSAPWSWCRSTPWILWYSPLTKKPSFASNRTQRKPNRVLVVSTRLPATVTSVSRV
jgi:hypothetical protein